MDYLQIRELYHDGIKGMKWGIRRYQNYDGTLTEEGRLRYNKNYNKDRSEGSLPTKDKDGNYYYTNKEGKKTLYKTRSEQLSDTELTDLNRRVQQENKLAAETSSAYDPPEYKGPKADQAFRDASKLTKDISESLPKGNGRVIKKDYSNLSDQELRDRINRLQLEDNYGRLTGDTKYVKSGSEKAREFLQTAGALLAITGSAVALANTIADMQDKKKLRMQQSMRQSDILDENENTLEHYGIEGQKWGLRRYQNEDGTLTEAGRLRYGGKTHVSELDEDELNDLHAAREYQHKKKLAIGIGLGVGAAAAITAGATWLARRSQQRTNTLNQQNRQNDRNVAELIDVLDSKPSSSRTNKGTIIDAVFKDVKKTDYHMNQPDKVKPNLFSLPAPKSSINSSSYHMHEPDRVKPNLFSLPAPKSSKAYVKNGALYQYRNGKETLLGGGSNSRYEYTTNSSGQILRTVKKNFKPSWLRHADTSDYLVFREMYLSSFDTLAHHGIKGQKWGVRRYQDQNGNMTAEGKQRYRTNQGTKEIIDNSDTYSKLVGQNKRQYVNYGKSSGAKRGFLIGLGTGAAAGAGKTIFETVVNRNKLGSGEFTTNRVINRFIRNTMIGAFGGSVIGTLYGSVAGKKSAQAKLADKGQAYTNELLNTPIDRIARRR